MCAVDPHASHSVTFTSSCPVSSGLQRSRKSGMSPFPVLRPSPPADHSLDHLLSLPRCDPETWLSDLGGPSTESSTLEGGGGGGRGGGWGGENREEEKEKRSEKDPAIRCCVVDEEVSLLASWGPEAKGRTWLCWGGGQRGLGSSTWKDSLPSWTSEAAGRRQEAQVPLLLEGLRDESVFTHTPPAHHSHSSWPHDQSTRLTSCLSGPFGAINALDDNNNHLQDVAFLHEKGVKERGEKLFTREEETLGCTTLRGFFFSDSKWTSKRGGNAATRQKPPIVALIANTVSKLKTFYKRCKHARRRESFCHECTNSRAETTFWSPCRSQEEVRGVGGGRRRRGVVGRQHGDRQGGANQSPRWWHSSGTSGKRSGTSDARKGRSASHDEGRAVHARHSASNSNFLRKSLDVEYRGRQRRTKGELKAGLESSDDDGSDDVFEDPPKYRDKLSLTRVSRDDSVAQTPFKVTAKKPLEKTFFRGRLERDGNNSRKRLSYRNVDRESSSSSSSNSSQSNSARRLKSSSRSKLQVSKKKSIDTNGSPEREELTLHHTAPEHYQANPMQHKTNFVQNSSDSTQHRSNFKVKDSTGDFLAQLDSVLSDLVEHEKKRISRYGDGKEGDCKSLKNNSSEGPPKDLKMNKREKPEDPDQNSSSSLQQLRATLKTVRVKKRVPIASDVIDKHSEYFTESLPHQPRILKSNEKSQLLTQRCYQPPRRKTKSASRERASITTGEEVQRASGKPHPALSSEEDPVENRETSDPSDSTFEREDVDEQSGYSFDEQTGESDHDRYCEIDQPAIDEHKADDQVSVQSSLRARDGTKDWNFSCRAEAGDSGDFSVDSAYTGSRGATPESILNPGAKPRVLGSSILPTTRRPRSSSSKHLTTPRPRLENIQLVEVKRTILRDIKESGLYSDDSINALLDQHRSRWAVQLGRKEVEEVIRSVQDDLGVKPHATHYVCQILAAAEGNDLETNVGATSTPTDLPMCHSLIARTGTKESNTFARSYGTAVQKNTKESRTPRRSYEDIEDEVWARSVMKDLDPGIVDEARKEARTSGTEEDLPSYVIDLCQKFDVQI